MSMAESRLDFANPNFVEGADLVSLERHAHSSDQAPPDRSACCGTMQRPEYTLGDPKVLATGGSMSAVELEEGILGAGRIRVYLSGDLHHYRRHSQPAPDGTLGDVRHKITAGGGGAFLHPTHDGDVERIDRGRYELRKAYPEPSETRRMGLGLPIAFLWRNPSFGLLTALVYFVTGSAVRLREVAALGPGDLPEVLARLGAGAMGSGFAVLWSALVIIGTLHFVDSHSPRYRAVAGSLHGLAHLLVAAILGWLTAHLVHLAPVPAPLEEPLASALLFALGLVVGPLIVGLYLCVSIVGFGRHGNDAFAALRVPHRKSFLRLHVQSDGTLRIYPVKIDRVPGPREWRAAQDGKRAPAWEPIDHRLARPELIEKWFDVRGG
jgi:hypothetical protein